jgi:3-hydroxyacyl-CoA dehydrogenase
MIRTAAVIGAGTMGAQIAALLANVGIKCHLLDLPSPKKDEDRNSLVRQLLDRAAALTPPPFFKPKLKESILIGNVEDNLEALKSCDWVVEAVIEELEAKRAIHKLIEDHANPKAWISTNTSGLKLTDLTRDRSPEYRARFFGSHFFNPPRSMYLVELVATPDTNPKIASAFYKFATETLGKGVVPCRDTPGFISNRIGFFAIQHAIWSSAKHGLSPVDVDQVTGVCMGRPKSATFRLADIIGIDVLHHIGTNLLRDLPEDSGRDFFQEPSFMSMMRDRGILGQKAGGGFYRREADRKLLALDLSTLEYRPLQLIPSGTLLSLHQLPAGERLRELVKLEDPFGLFAWDHLASVLLYSAEVAPEIASDPLSVDRVMRWGFNWERGPFELWDALGVEETVERMQSEGRKIPLLLPKVLGSKEKSFYSRRKASRTFFDFATNKHKTDVPHPLNLVLNSMREEKALEQNAGATLLDLGDGILCLEWQSKLNVIGGDQLELMNAARDLLEAKDQYTGMIIANQGVHFSAGADVRAFWKRIADEDWKGIGEYVSLFQQTVCFSRYSPKPILVACHGYTLGGGCEVALGADHHVVHAELRIGLPETRLGLIPTAGGCKELLFRFTHGKKPGDELAKGTHRAWSFLTEGKILHTSGEVFESGLFKPEYAHSVMNLRHLPGVAKQRILELTGSYRPADRMPRQTIPVAGRNILEALEKELPSPKSPLDEKIAHSLAWLLCGGNHEGPSAPEEYFLDLEREVFVQLCAEQETRTRIEQLLKPAKEKS